MADGIFSRLGRMVDGGLAKLESAETNAISGALTKAGQSFMHEAEQGRQHKNLFASGPLAKLEDVESKLISGALAKTGQSLIQDAENGKQHKALFASAEIHGGESVHSASKPNATPSIPHAAKGTKIREV